MKNLESIAEDLFNKIRGRFPSVTIGDEEGKMTNVPGDARYFDFDYKDGEKVLGKVSVSIDENSLSVMYSDNFVANEDTLTQDKWFNFLKELRQFSKRRMLNFDTRNITKSNLNKRDYHFLATNRTGDETMIESKMYGTNKTSFQKIGNARLSIKHTEAIDVNNLTSRSQKIGKIYIESPEGERFKYPYKHLSGARAMARHVAEGGNPFDDFGKHITGLSEELSKLRKFKTYMGRSSVMAESLAGYLDIVKERMESIKKDVSRLQKESYYKQAVESFEVPVVEDVPEDIAENWIDQLTIKQFNEELKDVFPFVYRLVSEATRAKALNHEDLVSEAPITTSPRPQARPQTGVGSAAQDDPDIRQKGSMDRIQGPAGTVKVRAGMTIAAIARAFNDQNNMGGDLKEFEREIMRMNNITDPSRIQVGQVLQMPYVMGTGRDGASRGLPPGGFTAYEDRLEKAFEELMGQFSEAANDCNETCPKSCPDCGGTGDPAKYRASKAAEGNAYAHAVRQAKMNGKKKGDKVQGPDGDEITLEKDRKIPLGEFILSYFDYTTGQFPKGETAILTMVEKDYGEHFIEPAKMFIEKINNRVSEVMGYRDTGMEESGLQYHIGKKKYGKKGMAALAQAGREGASQEELGRIKDRYTQEAELIRRLAGL